MYGKLVDDELIIAPRMVQIEHNVIFNPSEEVLEQVGYKLLVFNEQIEEEDGLIAESYWEEENKYIVQKWRLINLEA